MSIQADSAGFLQGERRLKELASNVNQVQDNTAEILSIIKNALGQGGAERDKYYRNVSEITRAISQVTKARPTTVNVSVNLGAKREVTRNTSKRVTFHTAADTGDSNITRKETRQVSNNANGGGGQEVKGRITGVPVKTSSQPTISNGRDAQGRFTSSAQGINDKSLTESIKKGFQLSNLGSGPDVGGLDPTVDAVRELTSVFTPARRAFGLMGRGALWLYKKAKPKRSEVLPGEQKNHNDEVERHNYEERKVLKKILDAINRANGNSGLLSGLAGLVPGIGRKGRNGKPGPNNTSKKKIPPAVPLLGKDKPKTKTPGKLAKLGGKVLGKVPLLGALLGAGMVASDWADQDNGGRGAGIGSVVGAGIGGVIGSFAGPVGSIAGGTVGSMLGEKVGRTIGDWTNTLKKDDIGGAIVKRWDNTLEGINKFIKESWSRSGFGGFGSTMAAGGGMMLASFRRPGGGSGYGGYATDNGSTANVRNKAEEQKNQLDVYNAMRTAGFSKSQAQALTAEVGRENGYQSKYLFGTHKDASNGKTNMGMISWQGKRAERLYKSMSEQGFIKDGKMVRSQEALIAQAKFMKQEIENDKSYAKTKQMFHDNPNADPESYAKTLGTNYIGWRYGQDKLADGTPFDWQQHNAVRRGQLKTLQGKTDGINQPTAPQQAAPKQLNNQGAKPLYVSTSKPASQTKPLYVSNSSKPAPVPAVQFPKVIHKENSNQSSAPMMAGNHSGIPQNVADRDLTHAMTGGLGMRSALA